MNNGHVLLYGNDNLLEVRGLRDEVAGSYLNSATVSVTVIDATGANVGGASWPMALAYVTGSNGNYRGTLPYTLGIAEGSRYTAIVQVNGGPGLVGRWELPCLCQARD